MKTSAKYNGCVLKGLTESCKPLPYLEVLQQSLFPTTDLAKASGMWKRIQLKKNTNSIMRNRSSNIELIQTYTWVKVFNNEPNKIFGQQPLKIWSDMGCLSFL